VLAQRFGKDALIEQAKLLDAEFDIGVLAYMIGTLRRYDDHEIPLRHGLLPFARVFFRLGSRTQIPPASVRHFAH
jgi:hypothetical protein